MPHTLRKNINIKQQEPQSHPPPPPFKAKDSEQDKLKAFLGQLEYVPGGAYDKEDGFKKLDDFLGKHEAQCANRIFYLALPPSVFKPVTTNIRKCCWSQVRNWEMILSCFTTLRNSVPLHLQTPPFFPKSGWNRVIVEKPFGRDSQSSAELSEHLGELFDEKEIYRIDHYLGKEMVQNLFILRCGRLTTRAQLPCLTLHTLLLPRSFGNMVYSPIWNRNYISSVQISFKEPFGTKGRGGYFDEFGIIRSGFFFGEGREELAPIIFLLILCKLLAAVSHPTHNHPKRSDIAQNHLLQVLCIVAMEKPVSTSAEDIRAEKVKVLKSIPALKVEGARDLWRRQLGPDIGILSSHILFAQTASSGSTLLATSKATRIPRPATWTSPTSPMLVAPAELEANKTISSSIDSTPLVSPFPIPPPSNTKDSNTPTFACLPLHINNERWEGVPFVLRCGKALNERKMEIRIQFKDVPGNIFESPVRNELVIRVQPNEAIYLKMLIKQPGMSFDAAQVEIGRVCLTVPPRPLR